MRATIDLKERDALKLANRCLAAIWAGEYLKMAGLKHKCAYDRDNSKQRDVRKPGHHAEKEGQAYDG
jgi:hypothetical protein